MGLARTSNEARARRLACFYADGLRVGVLAHGLDLFRSILYFAPLNLFILPLCLSSKVVKVFVVLCFIASF